MGILANENSISAGGYTIERSLRFQSASSQYLSRTPASAGNQTKWTWSAWVKRGSLGSVQSVFGASSSSASQTASYLRFTGSDTLEFLYITNGSVVVQVVTSQVFRDPSAWYHLVVTYNSTEATSSNRVKIYVNGTQVTAFGTATYPSLNASTNINAVIAHTIGSIYAPTAFGQFFDGYQTEINFINDQALTPSSFGETDPLTGSWVAKPYTGTYGTNGFYLKFNDGTSTTTLGQDRSGNTNNWTLTNFTRSAGVSDCWMLDVPSGNGSPAATQPSSNYAVWNPLNIQSSMTITNANLTTQNTGTVARTTLGTIGVTSGKWYWELTAFGVTSLYAGVCSAQPAAGGYVGDAATGWAYANNGQKINSASFTAYGSSWTTNDVIGVALDMDAGTITFYKNNVSQGQAFSGITGTIFPAMSPNGVANNGFHANFGQRSFAYTPPSGFKALCTANLPTPTIAKGNQYMDATLYTGNGASSRAVTGLNFSPDFVWLKGRSVALVNGLFNTISGVNKFLVSNSTIAEVNNDPDGYITAFNSDGFTLGSGSSSNNTFNQNGTTYVAWQWDAGSSTVTNTSGSISSQVRANTTAGVSVVTYTGNFVAGATVGHGLGIAPAMIIAKRRNSLSDWPVYHKSMNPAQNMWLNLTNAATNNISFNSSNPTSSIFSLGQANDSNANGGTYVAYCFAEVAGFSKFGSYTGNGSTDGVFVYTGFTPKYILIKASSGADNWAVRDTARSPFNVGVQELYPNLSNAEGTGSSGNMDILSNGFKFRGTSNNNSGVTFIYAAFAENPFNYSNAR